MQGMRVRAVGLCALLLLSAGCGSSPEAPEKLQLPKDGLPASCNPFRSAGACALPFPSTAYEKADPTTATGYRLALAPDAMPASAAGSAFDPTRWNELDGFSPATPILVYFEKRIDASSLPPRSDYTKSLDPSSATVLVDMETNQLVPHFSEVDLSSDITPDERQPMMIRPAMILKPDHRYAVGITRTLKAVDGTTPAMPPGFKSALAGAKSDNPVAKRMIDDLPDVLSSIEKAGVRKKDLLLAWDFHTASLQQMTGNVLSMRDQALKKVGPTGLGYHIDMVEQDPQPEVSKRITGTFTVPSFLTENDRSVADTKLSTGADGKPQIVENAQYPFELVIPKSAETNGPYPLLVYGHGLLGDMSEVDSGHTRGFENDKGYVGIATDWIGMSYTEAAGVGANAAALEAVKDVNHFPWVGDRLQQSMINFMVLTRTAKQIVKDPQALVGGKSAVVDPMQVYYYGISQGSILGASLLAYSPDIQRGVLQVGGTAYSLMIQRSVDWTEFYPSLRNGYPDRVDQQLVMALWQSMFDMSEGSGTAYAQGKHAPLPGTQKKQLLFQAGVGDCQVSNLATEIQARTLGTPLLSPSALDVWGLDTTQGGGDLALTFYDLGRTPPPDTNATPYTDNDVHGDIRKLLANQEQTDHFLKTGTVENSCGGPCSFPGFQP